MARGKGVVRMKGRKPLTTPYPLIITLWVVVGVAQLVEPRVVIPVVVGSSPIAHPIFGTECLTPDSVHNV